MKRVLVAILLALPVVTGCDGGSAAGGDSPASAVPAGAPIYLEVTLRPEGDLRDDALAAAGKVLRTSDPEQRIRELVDQAFAESEDPKLDYGRDIEPWLGERAALWLGIPARSGEPGRGVALLAADDTAKAQDSLDAALKRSGEKVTERSYKDVDYKVSSDGAAVGIVGGFAALGTEAQFKQTVDAADGESLADSDRYDTSLDGLPDERLGHFYVDVKSVFAAAARQNAESRPQLEQFSRSFGVDKLGPVAGAFTANGERLGVDAAATQPSEGAFGRLAALSGTGSTPLLGELPGDSWAALGVPKFGETLKLIYDQVAGALGGAAIAAQIREQSGLDLQQDLLSWIGDVAFFVRGTTIDDVQGGAVIEITDEQRAAAALGKVAGALRARAELDVQPTRIAGAQAAFTVPAGGAKSIVIARGDGRMVVTLGEEAARQALAPAETLADTDNFKQAANGLGDGLEPAFLLAMPAVVSLAQSSGKADAEFEKARPYLEAFGVLAHGSRRDGDRTLTRFIAALK